MVVALAMPSIGVAADWVFFSNTKDALWSIDAESIRQKPGHIEVWAKELTTNPKASGGVHVQKWMYRLDCDEQTIGAVSFVQYSDAKESSVVNSHSVSWPKMVPVPPETIGDNILKLGCGLAAGEKWALDKVQISSKAKFLAATGAPADGDLEVVIALAYIQVAAEAAADISSKHVSKDDAALSAAERAAGLRTTPPE